MPNNFPLALRAPCEETEIVTTIRPFQSSRDCREGLFENHQRVFPERLRMQGESRSRRLA